MIAPLLCGDRLAWSPSRSFPVGLLLTAYGLQLHARRGAPRLVRPFPCLLAMVFAMALAGVSDMIPIMFLLGPVDMSLFIVDIFSSVGHHYVALPTSFPFLLRKSLSPVFSPLLRAFWLCTCTVQILLDCDRQAFCTCRNLRLLTPLSDRTFFESTFTLNSR